MIPRYAIVMEVNQLAFKVVYLPGIFHSRHDMKLVVNTMNGFMIIKDPKYEYR